MPAVVCHLRNHLRFCMSRAISQTLDCGSELLFRLRHNWCACFPAMGGGWLAQIRCGWPPSCAGRAPRVGQRGYCTDCRALGAPSVSWRFDGVLPVWRDADRCVRVPVVGGWRVLCIWSATEDWRVGERVDQTSAMLWVQEALSNLNGSQTNRRAVGPGRPPRSNTKGIILETG